MANLAIDTSAQDNIQPLLGQQQLQQSFNLQKAAALQQIQSSGIDALTKGNDYAYQALAQALPQGQDKINATLADLQSKGIDTSSYSSDPSVLGQQLNNVRVLKSPIASLLELGQKQTANYLTARNQLGDAGARAAGITPFAGLGSIAGPQAPSALSPSTPPLVSTILSPAAPSNPTPQIMPNQGGPQLPMSNNSATPIDGSDPAISIVPNGQTGQPIPSPQAPNQQSTAPANAPPVFVPPANDPNLSVDQNQKQQDSARANFELNNKGALAGQEDQGKLTTENLQSAKKADELTQRLAVNLAAMSKLNPNVPSSGFVPGGVKTYLSQAEGANPILGKLGIGDNGAGAVASDQWDQINNQQVLSEIQQFLASGGANTRINQTLDKIVQAASGIHKDDLPAARQAQIDNALAEIGNKNVSAQNIAGANQAYQPIPVTTVSQPMANQAAMQNSFAAAKATASPGSNPAPDGYSYTTPKGVTFTKINGKWVQR